MRRSRRDLEAEVVRLEHELDDARRLLRGVGVMCLNASAPQLLVQVEDRGAVPSGQVGCVGDSILDRGDVAGLEWQVAEQT